MLRKSIPNSISRQLYLSSGPECAMPDCKIILSTKNESTNKISYIGEIAHICGIEQSAARFDNSLDPNDVDNYNNLILLCRNCHKKIDSDVIEYSPSKLRRIKIDHEKSKRTVTLKSIIDVSFAELDVLTKYLTSDTVSLDEDYTITHLGEKIKKNELSSDISSLIRIGMSRVNLIGKYIDHNLDVSFGIRLRTGFINEYKKLCEKNHSGDEIFSELLYYAGGMSNDPKKYAAALAIVVYFFETCEVFEK